MELGGGHVGGHRARGGKQEVDRIIFVFMYEIIKNKS